MEVISDFDLISSGQRWGREPGWRLPDPAKKAVTAEGHSVLVLGFGTDSSQPIKTRALRGQQQESCPSVTCTKCKSDHVTPLKSISEGCPLSLRKNPKSSTPHAKVQYVDLKSTSGVSFLSLPVASLLPPNASLPGAEMETQFSLPFQFIN